MAERAGRLCGALIGSEGLLALGTHCRVYVSLCTTLVEVTKKRCKEYKFRFSFKGCVEAEGPVLKARL